MKSFHVKSWLVLAAVALCVFAAAAGTTNARAASMRAACTDRGFRAQASAETSQESTALSYLQMNAYTPAEAWALRGWRTMRATSPCWVSYRRYRMYELKAAAALWNAVRFAKRGDDADCLTLMRQSARWGQHAAAEQANWP